MLFLRNADKESANRANIRELGADENGQITYTRVHPCSARSKFMQCWNSLAWISVIRGSLFWLLTRAAQVTQPSAHALPRPAGALRIGIADWAWAVLGNHKRIG